ncbi:MAG: hypothetical protein OEZ39_11485 [Gammaproteobacteria bacterium]|nr:hypothetical protein [Gammaproteobacteria bacterium]MDH5652465.1 hypothetical protein [Gammaproteobacteria bacterium]
MKIKILAVVLLLAPGFCFAKAGPKIPLPEINLFRAVDISRDIMMKEHKIADPDIYKVQDYIVTSVVYTKQYQDKEYDEWGWVVVFTHPEANDHTATYRIVTVKKFHLISITE